MDLNHLILFVLWILYCFIHSLLAATRVKSYFEKKSGNLFRYYRLSYTVIATITLLLLIYFQYSFISPALINSRLIKYLSLILLVIPGGVIMIISILKYLKYLNLVQVKDGSYSGRLQRRGIHSYVRHPLYTGTIIFLWGMFFVFPMLNNLIAVTIITSYVLIGIRFEETKLMLEFGETYRLYRRKVPMLVPRFRITFPIKKG